MMASFVTDASAVVDVVTEFAGAEWLILAYIVYQFEFGKLDKIESWFEAMAAAIIALSRRVDGVDTEAVTNQLPHDVARVEHMLDEREDEYIERVAEKVAERKDTTKREEAAS